MTYSVILPPRDQTFYGLGLEGSGLGLGLGLESYIDHFWHHRQIQSPTVKLKLTVIMTN